MKKLVIIFVMSLITCSFGAFAQTKLQVLVPTSGIFEGDAVLQPIGGAGHQGLIFNIPTQHATDYTAFGSAGVLWMWLLNDKTVKIDGKLLVNNTLFAKQIEVSTTFWSDFVFNPEYKLMPLNELESFIKENNHLPNIPTEAEVKTNGINVAEMNAKLLEKVEELTLYVIQLKKENEQIKKILPQVKQ